MYWIPRCRLCSWNALIHHLNHHHYRYHHHSALTELRKIPHDSLSQSCSQTARTLQAGALQLITGHRSLRLFRGAGGWRPAEHRDVMLQRFVELEAFTLSNVCRWVKLLRVIGCAVSWAVEALITSNDNLKLTSNTLHLSVFFSCVSALSMLYFTYSFGDAVSDELSCQ